MATTHLTPVGSPVSITVGLHRGTVCDPDTDHTDFTAGDPNHLLTLGGAPIARILIPCPLPYARATDRVRYRIDSAWAWVTGGAASPPMTGHTITLRSSGLIVGAETDTTNPWNVLHMLAAPIDAESYLPDNGLLQMDLGSPAASSVHWYTCGVTLQPVVEWIVDD